MQAIASNKTKKKKNTKFSKIQKDFIPLSNSLCIKCLFDYHSSFVPKPYLNANHARMKPASHAQPDGMLPILMRGSEPMPVP